jgi:hypothetical protein
MHYLYIIYSTRSRPVQNERKSIFLLFSSVIWQVVTFREIFFTFHTSAPTGSNDIGVKTEALPGAESIAVQTNR